MEAKDKPKRKRVNLSIEQKIEILEKLDRGISNTAIASEYSIGKSTVTDIQKSRSKITQFAVEAKDSSSFKKRCIVRRADDDQFDKAMHLWFTQERHKGTPLSGVVVMEKARLMHQQMYPDRSPDDFKASTGWLHRFKQRHGIRQLSMQGESLSANPQSAEAFKLSLHKYIEDHKLSIHQIFNCDETGLCWRLLPNKTLADGSEKAAKNCKSPKDRVTLMATANVSGDMRSPLVFIHKSAKPRCFSGVNMSSLPVHYYSQKSAWMDQSIFLDWFFKHFVPEVKRYLKSKSLPLQALLIMDNAPSHPSVEALSSEGMSCMFLPPNVTSLVQPMDQGVLENLKRRYKRELMRKLLLQSESSEDSFISFSKKLTIKDAVYLSAKSWNEIPEVSLCRAWNKLGFGGRSMGDASRIDASESEEEITFEVCSQLGINEEEMEQWLLADKDETGSQSLTDEEIIDSVQVQDPSDSEDEAEHTDVAKISHTKAVDCFSVCLEWLEQQPEATPINLMLLRELLDLAGQKRGSALKQKTMDCYFSNP
ncbi:jerky protein homolog-like [Corticium candelabrum]|uniref:jerky protein homolog-like n=1 Tax=Corticium candelabrum TaxID=121492 RepID=UPI002E26B9A2|nr:jerky protein homolog-like [Corticium candelabrum]